MPVTTEHFLYPSKIYASKEPCNIKTLLGSCVSVCMYDYKLKIGGMNHYMLPVWNEKQEKSSKYGDVAIELLMLKMYKLGCEQKNIIAKVFGGANVIVNTGENVTIGETNSLLAISELKKIKIPIMIANIGGNYGRKLIFNTYTGEVKMKLLKD